MAGTAAKYVDPTQTGEGKKLMTEMTERLLPLCRNFREKVYAGLQVATARRYAPKAAVRTHPDRGPQVLHSTPASLAGKRICCFAHYDPEPMVDPSVFAYLEELSRSGFLIIFVSSAPGLPPAILERLIPLCERVLLRANVGLDFASWKDAFETFPDMFEADVLLLANDSAWLTGPLEPVFSTMRTVPCDFWGMVESRERRPHLQSNFLFFHKKAITSNAFRHFWCGVAPLESKKFVIRRYETALTLHLALEGLRAAAFVPSWWLPDRGRNNPSLYYGLTLLPLLGVPLLKRQLLRENPAGTALSGWERHITLPGMEETIRAHAARLGQALPPSGIAEPYTPPRVDALLPVYNGIKFLPAMLASIKDQKPRPPRLIARDDGSSDGSFSLLKDYALKHTDTVYEGGNNVGVVSNLASLLRQSDAPYFVLADQDDYWFPHKVLSLYEAMARLEKESPPNTPLLVFSDARLVDAKGEQIAPSFRKATNIPAAWGGTLAQTLVMSPAPGCTMLGNAALRELALPFPDGIFMHDWWLLLVAKTMGKAVSLPFALTDYRQHRSNVLGAGAVTIPGRVLRRLKTKSSIPATQRQAGALLERFVGELSADARDICEAWASMQSIPYCKRLCRCFRYGFHKPGLRFFSFLLEI